MWQDDRDGDPRIYANRSLDSGAHFEPTDLLVSEALNARKSARNPALGCDGGTVAIAWEDDRDSDFKNPTIRVRVSDDGLTTFTTPSKRVTSDLFGDWRAIEPAIAVAGRSVFVAWADGRSGAFDIFLSTSPDAGRSFQTPELRLDTDAAGAAHSASPQLALNRRGGVFVVWSDRRARRNAIRGNVSRESGRPGSWLTSDLSVDGDQTKNAYSPSIAALADLVAIAWHARASDLDPADIYSATMTSSIADGFSRPVRVDTDVGGVGNSSFVRLVVDDSKRLQAVWRDDRSGYFDIFASRSLDAGATWSELETRLDRGGSGTHSDSPELSVAGSRVAVVWPDLRGSTPETPAEDVYVAFSDDGGASFSEERRVDDEASQGARSVFPVVALDAAKQAHVFWEDWRAGNSDIYERTLSLGGDS